MVAGKYRVERVLAEGAMGMVVEATDVGRGLGVAVKVLRAGRRTAALEARFEREARIANKLAGEHVARVDAYGHTGTGDPFLVTELLTGRDLAAELLASGPLPVASAVDVVVEACAGVAEAHAAGLVHTGLKPANLFLSSGPNPSTKVLDFGLTGVAHEKGQIDLAATEANFASPQYMAPEQIRGAHPVDARTDQHALGAVLHELLTGRPPFVAPDVTQLAVAIATQPPPHAREARPEVPRALDAALQRALGKRPRDRFPDLVGFAEAVAPFGGERAHAALQRVRAALAPGVATTVPPGSCDPGATTTEPRRGRMPYGSAITGLSAAALLMACGGYGLATYHARPVPAASAVPASAPEAAATTGAPGELVLAPASAPSVPAAAEASAPTPSASVAVSPAPASTAVPSASARAKRADIRPASNARIVSR
jgi:hypothetical protein